MMIAVAQIALRNAASATGNQARDPDVAVSLVELRAIAGMAAVLIAMAVTPALQQDFNVSCVTLAVAVRHI